MPDRQPPKTSARATGRTSFAAHELGQDKQAPAKDRTAFSAAELKTDHPLRDQDNVQMRPKPRGISLDHPRLAPPGSSGIRPNRMQPSQPMARGPSDTRLVDERDMLLLQWYHERRSVAADKTANPDHRHVSCCEADDMLKGYPHMREAFEQYDKSAALRATAEQATRPSLDDGKPSEASRAFNPLASGQPKDRGFDR